MMELLAKFLKLNNRQKILYAETATTLTILRTLLAILPYRWIDTFISKTTFKNKNGFALFAIKRSIRSISKHLPFTKHCLVKALAGKFLFLKYGYEPVLCIGALKDKDKLKAHAWLEINGRIVLGRTHNIISYVPLSKTEQQL